MFGFDAMLLDRAHKFYQVNMQGWTGGEFQTVTPFLDYVLVWNRGVSYGFLSGMPQPVVLLVIATAFAVLCFWWFTAKSFVLRLGLALALGGALSNIIDRVQYGAVADFFHLHWGARSFFVFNLADAMISLGAVLLILDMVLPKKKINT